MNIKLPFIAFFTLVVMVVFFMVNPSYEKSLEAKFYYEIGDYKEAYTLSKEAFGLDVYNRMASTIMTQSQTSLKFVEYVEDAKKYIAQINEMAKKDILEDSDKAKIKTITQIMLMRYKKLAPSVITDKKLVEDTKNYYLKFEKLLEKINQ